MKVGIITIIDNNNYGNRLQNYAVQYTLSKMGVHSETLLNDTYSNTRKMYLLRKIKNNIFAKKNVSNSERLKFFSEFNKKIVFSENKITPYSKSKDYDYFLTGSDQVWNPNIARFREVDLLEFVPPSKRISMSASFGVNILSKKQNKMLKRALLHYKAISVREDAGKSIIEKVINRNDIQVLIDPTMLLTADEWEKVAKKPNLLKSSKYILNYFLGELSEKRKKQIYDFAEKNECKVINILDSESPFYNTGPSEFLYLEKHAFLICTDSFHASVFAILFKRPFIVFEREDKTINMSSRIQTLLSKFKLENRKYNDRIDNSMLKCDYNDAYIILRKEREKSKIFLKNALNLYGSDKNE